MFLGGLAGCLAGVNINETSILRCHDVRYAFKTNQKSTLPTIIFISVQRNVPAKKEIIIPEKLATLLHEPGSIKLVTYKTHKHTLEQLEPYFAEDAERLNIF